MRDDTGLFNKKEQSTDNAVAAGIVILAAIPCIVVIGCTVRAYVLSTLWAWYIMPFFGTKPLPLAIAFGIALIYSYLNPVNISKDERKLSEKIGMAVCRPIVVLAFGWLGTYFL